MDFNSQVSSIHGILQARILEWVAIPFSRGSSQTRDQTPVSCIGRIDAEAPILWSPDAKSRLIRKDPDAGKDWRQEEKGTTEDEMVAWHHHVMVDGHEFEQAPGVGDGQGSLACCNPRGRKESYMTEQLN